MDHNISVEINEYLPLRDVVFQALRKAIITGEFSPGERLMEIALAQKLGVSRTPVREAIRMLEQDGLVNMIPRKGAHVAQITEKSLMDVMEIRITLEELAASLACQRITKEGKANLQKIHHEFIQAVEQCDTMAIAGKDQQFHDCIFAASDNKRLIDIINNLQEQIYRYRLEYVKDLDCYRILIEDHEKLLHAILNNNPETAKMVMREHLIRQQDKVIEVIRQLKA